MGAGQCRCWRPGRGGGWGFGSPARGSQQHPTGEHYSEKTTATTFSKTFLFKHQYICQPD